MSVNKNALIRYKVLDKCFRNSGRNYFIDDLINECNAALQSIDPEFNGISRRQIFDDIAFMESEEGWAIDLARLRDGKKVHYRYTDTSFSINSMPLNEVEINNLKSAIDILSQFQGMPQFDWMGELVEKLSQEGLNISNQAIIAFDNNQYLRGIEHLSVLRDAIVYKKTLSVLYHPFTADKPFCLTLHPYFLKQYNNRWFVFGFNPLKNKYDWTLALDRIVEIQEINESFETNCPIDWEDYFDDIIGVTKPENVAAEDVILKFYGIAGKYVESKPLHGSQKGKWIDRDHFEVRLTIVPNTEFEQTLLSFGESVQVSAPKSLREQLYKRIKLMLDVYSNADTLHSSDTPL